MSWARPSTEPVVPFAERVRRFLEQLPAEPRSPTYVNDSLQGHSAACYCGWSGTTFPTGSRQLADAEAAGHQCERTARAGERMKASWMTPLLREADRRVAELEVALAEQKEETARVLNELARVHGEADRLLARVVSMKRSWRWVGKRDE